MQPSGANGHHHGASEKSPTPSTFPCRVNADGVLTRDRRW